MYAIGHDALDDKAAATIFATKIVANARLAGDVALEYRGRIDQLSLAGNAGDADQVARLVASFGGRGLVNPYCSERFHRMIAVILAYGWSGNFHAAGTHLAQLRNADALTLPQRSLCDALLAVVALSSWDLERVRRLARQTISRTGLPPHREALHDSWMRDVARVLAVAICVCVGDEVRARRALPIRVDPLRRLSSAMSRAGLGEAQVPVLMRGCARFPLAR